MTRKLTVQLTRRVSLVAAVAAIACLAPSASAATLALDYRWVDDPELLEYCGYNDYSPDGCYGWYEHYVTYTAGSERNKVTVAGDGIGGDAVVLNDPNVPITVRNPGYQAFPNIGDPDPDRILNQGDVPVDTAWDCESPQGRGNAVCFVTPGEAGLGSFDGLTFVLGAGDDQLRFLRGSMGATVWADAGNDTVDTRNGIRDDVHCGDGADTALLDWKDVVYPSCETVTRGGG